MDEATQLSSPRLRSFSCSDCGETQETLYGLRVHYINSHIALTFFGQFIYVPDADSLKKYCDLEGFIGYWDGPGWYGRDDYQDCNSEWQTQIISVDEVRKGLVEQVASAHRKISLIDSLPEKAPT